MENWWNTHNRKRNGLNTKCAVRPAFFIFFLPKCYIYFHGTHQWSCCLMPGAAWHCGSEPGGWSTGEQCAVCPQNSAQVQVRVCSLLVVLTLGNYLPCEPQFSYLESGARNDSSGSKGLWGSDDWCMKPRRRMPGTSVQKVNIQSPANSVREYSQDFSWATCLLLFGSSLSSLLA